MAWPKGKPRPDAFKPKVAVATTDKYTCDCGNRMVETDYLNQLPGFAEYTCLKCDAKRIVNFHQ